MVNNEVPCYTLGEQHRMRPEIASLITPSIYNELKNHLSVYNREHIRGVIKDMFFLNHNIYENEVCYIMIIFHHNIIQLIQHFCVFRLRKFQAKVMIMKLDF